MFRLSSFLIVGLLLIYAIENSDGTTFITGKITHDGVNHIDKSSRVEITLQDVSLMDVGAKRISSTVISDANTFPISYKLEYSPSDIKAHHTYALSVRISGPDYKLHFINDVQTTANLAASPSPVVNIAVIRVGGNSNPGTTKHPDKKLCGPVKCRGKPKACAYGYEKLDGCEICKCSDPCNPPGKPILCGPTQRCFVDKKPDGTFGTRCDVVPSKKDKDKKSDSKAVCDQPKVTGRCKAFFPRFYYISMTKTCESFVYGGCKGNENNFRTKADCEKACKA